MADNAQPNRPLSPHLSIYRVQMNSTMSIFHRFAGIGLAVTAVLLVWWFLAAATGAEYFGFVDGLLTSWIGILVLVISAWAFWYHFFNGLRHLRWDMGNGLGLKSSARTGWLALIGSAVMTVVTIWLAM